MRIGIDAKWFYDGPPSGRVVIRNLVKNLIDLASNDELYLFLNIKDKERVFPFSSSKVHLTYVWAGNNMLSNIFVIPLITLNMKLDVFVFQNFATIFSNFKRYVFIHDVLYKTYPEFYTMLEKIYLSPIKLLTKFAHRICTVSYTEKQRMIGYGFADNEVIDVVYNGVDVLFKPKSHQDNNCLKQVKNKYKLPDRFILYVGRLNVRKNIVNLLKSIPLIDNSDIKLVVVGTYDWKMTNIDTLMEQLGIKERVIMTGSVPEKELPLIYSLSTIFCFVSYAEGFGLPALEAMASGIPVVVSDRTSLPEICAEAALYADPDSSEEIAHKINLLLKDDNLRNKMIKNGLDRSNQFTWRNSAESLLKGVYKAVAGGGA